MNAPPAREERADALWAAVQAMTPEDHAWLLNYVCGHSPDAIEHGLELKARVEGIRAARRAAAALQRDTAPAQGPANPVLHGAPMFVRGGAELPPVPLSEGPCMADGCGHGVPLHSLALSTGDRLHCVTPGCKCNRYLSPRPGGLTDDEWQAEQAAAAPGGAA